MSYSKGHCSKLIGECTDFKDLYTVVLIGTVLLVYFSLGEIAQHHNNMLHSFTQLEPLMDEFETSTEGH